MVYAQRPVQEVTQTSNYEPLGPLPCRLFTLRVGTLNHEGATNAYYMVALDYLDYCHAYYYT